ncbi:MAG: hypothetical protein JWM47_3111 [Acidimicrobiales bacterium]|nr:hypothetical protein [Acidimicrobiales bacterium]
MSPVAGPLFAAAILLGAAGVLKVTRPDPTRVALRTAGLPATGLVARLIGLAEIAVAFSVLAVGGRWPAALLAGAYLAFAGFSVVVMARTAGRAPCGCFGASDAPLTRLHVAVDLVIAAVALAAVIDPVPGVVAVARHTPMAGVPFVGFSIVLAWLVQVLLTALPALQAAARPAGNAAR